MNPDDARVMLGLLVEHYELPRCRLDIGTERAVTGPAAASRAFAVPWENRIYFAKRLPEVEYESAVVHEFAHLLTYRRFGIRRLGGRTRRQDHHGPHFVDTLLEVVRLWYGDRTRYPWSREYRTVAKRAALIEDNA